VKWRTKKIPCDLCRKGVAPSADGWGKPCSVCSGYGSISLEALCKRIGEHPSTMTRVLRLKRVRVKTAERVLDRVLALVSPAPLRQPELFT
jgi:hypothetical protein